MKSASMKLAFAPQQFAVLVIKMKKERKKEREKNRFLLYLVNMLPMR